MAGRRGDAIERAATGAPTIPLEPARRRSSHHELRRWQHQLEIHAAGSADGCAGAGDGGEGQWRRLAIDPRRRVCRVVSRQTRGVDPTLSRRSARRRDGGVVPAVRVWRPARRCLDRYAPPCVSAVRSRRPSASGLGDRAGRQRQRRQASRRVQCDVRTAVDLGAMAATWLRAGADVAAGGGQPSRVRRHRAGRARSVHLGRHPARVLRQQHQDHRSDGRIHRSTPARREPALVGRRRDNDRGRSRIASSPSCCRSYAASSRRIAA